MEDMVIRYFLLDNVLQVLKYPVPQQVAEGQIKHGSNTLLSPLPHPNRKDTILKK